MLTHLAIVHSALHFEACMRLTADDRSALAVPASHVTGLIANIAAMWRVGGALNVVPEFKAESFITLLARERVTHTRMVPAMYRLCLMSDAPRARRPVGANGASAATAARRCRWRRSTRSPRACRR